MKNLNKLSFTTYKINESCINVPIENIIQEYDYSNNIKLYLFRLEYIHKYKSSDNLYTCYMSCMFPNILVKAIIPLELIYIHKIIGGYTYDRPLEDNEKFIIKEKMFKLVDKINTKQLRYYLVCYGYFMNIYKDKDANTKVKSGIQYFNITENYHKKLNDRKYFSYFIYTKNLDKALAIYLSNKKIKKLELDKIRAKIKKEYKFKSLPDEFFIK